MLYPTGARLYLAGRSSSKATAAITAIKAAHPSVKNGFLEFLQLDLGDLTTIKASADAFLKLETRLDVLWLNAGVWYLSSEAKTAQGYEAQIGTVSPSPPSFPLSLRPPSLLEALSTVVGIRIC